MTWKGYWIAETTTEWGLTTAHKVNTDDLSQAKRIASRQQVFQKTWLQIGTQVDSESGQLYGNYVISIKNPNTNKWIDLNRLF